jgi:NTE family protein
VTIESQNPSIDSKKSLLKQKQLPASLTFQQLHEHSPAAPTLRCFATDLTCCTAREFSYKKTPNVRIVDALRASMSLPLYFTPVPDPETGHLLSDGALLDTYPMAFLRDDERHESHDKDREGHGKRWESHDKRHVSHAKRNVGLF